jgi:quinoprotein relay system zinc metallohydrolase 2
MTGPRLACAVIALCAALHARVYAAPEPASGNSGFQVRQVAPGVFVHFGRPLPLDVPGHDDIANIGFILGARCAAVIDTGGSVAIGQALRAAVAHQTRLPICYIINTHDHVDHVLGNDAFRNDHASFVGHQRLPAEMARNRSFFLSQYAGDLRQPPSAEQIIAPDRTVADTLQLDLGNRPLQLRAWPTAHTDCDLTVLDQRTGTLFTGDLLFRERLPAVDGDVAGWLVVTDTLAKLPAQRAIPGHGPLAANLAQALQPEQQYLRTLLEDVQHQLDTGQSLQQAIDVAAQGQRAQWLLWDSTNPLNVTRVYQQLEWK